jgi:hypothetical protein
LKNKMAETAAKVYRKIVAHAYANAVSAVHGALIGTLSTDGKSLVILDAVPICHGKGGPSSVVVETALEQIEAAYCEGGGSDEAQKVEIVGWYTANELANDNVPSVAGKQSDTQAALCVV